MSMASTRGLIDATGLFSSKPWQTKHVEHGKKNKIKSMRLRTCFLKTEL